MNNEGIQRIVFGSPYEGFAVPEEAMPYFSLAGPQGGDLPLHSPFQVFIFQAALDEMWKHVRSNSPLECAGGLFGHPFIKPEALEPRGIQITFVIVAVAVPYQTTENSRGHVRVTAEALAQADAYVAREHAGLRPVGWYHSHPGLGVFLSGHDSVITRSIFNAPWHLAIVLDPVRNDPPGIFRGPEQERLPGYRILRELPKELHLIQLYNQGCDCAEAGDWVGARQRFIQLRCEFRDWRRELPYWHDKRDYRDVKQRLKQARIALRAQGKGPPQRPSTPPPVSANNERVSPPGVLHERPGATPGARTQPAWVPGLAGRDSARAATPRPLSSRVVDRSADLMDSLLRLVRRCTMVGKKILSKHPDAGQ